VWHTAQAAISACTSAEVLPLVGIEAASARRHAEGAAGVVEGVRDGTRANVRSPPTATSAALLRMTRIHEAHLPGLHSIRDEDVSDSAACCAMAIAALDANIGSDVSGAIHGPVRISGIS
jgi:hypothetical protein